MQLRSAGGQKILQDIGGDFRGDEEITSTGSHADVANGFPRDTGAHQRTEKIPMTQIILLKIGRPQADHGGIIFVKGAAFRIFRKKDEHFPLSILITTEELQTGFFAEEETCHFLFPGR